MKSLFRGIFNYRQSVEPPIYRHAFSKYQAWFRMTAILAKRVGVDPRVVRNYFPWAEGGIGKNYEISVEIEFHEIEEGPCVHGQLGN